MTLTFGSLFTGIGGIDLGLERAGMVCKWQVEIDDYATRVLAKHWPAVHRERDVRACGAHNLAAVDVIGGGFPCQDISYSGTGAGLAGTRSGLWYEFARIVGELLPRYVLVENVAALLTRGIDAVLGTLAAFGYDAEWHCLQAADVGAPHLRDRVFILAYTHSAGQRWSQQIEGFKDSSSWVSNDGKKRFLADARGFGRGESSEVPSGRKPFSALRRGDVSWLQDIHRREGGIWSTEPAVGRVVDGVPHRVDRLRGLGNAVVPQVAELMGTGIVEHARSK